MYSDQLNDKIKALFEQGMSAYRISKELGVTKYCVLQRGNRIGLDFSSKYKLKNPIRLNSLADKVIEMYNQGVSTNKISEQIGYASNNIWKLLNKHGIDTSPIYYDVDLDFFKKINSYKKSYLLGMWYADGCVKKDKISLQLTDKEIVEYAKKALKYEGPIHIIKPRKEGRLEQYDLTISRKVLVEDLISKGCSYKKSLILKFPTNDIVPDKLINHFILGWFDGDGNIYYHKKQNRWRVQLVGTREFLGGVSQTTNCKGYWSQRHPERNNNNWTLQIAVQSEIIKFLEFIYKDSQFCLLRKRRKANACLADLRSRV